MVVYGPPSEAYIKYFPLHLATSFQIVRNFHPLKNPDIKCVREELPCPFKVTLLRTALPLGASALGGLIVLTSDKPFHIQHVSPLRKHVTNVVFQRCSVNLYAVRIVILARLTRGATRRQNNPISPAHKTLRHHSISPAKQSN